MLNLPLKPLGSGSLNDDGVFQDLHTTIPDGSYFRLKLLRLMLGQKHSFYNDLHKPEEAQDSL